MRASALFPLTLILGVGAGANLASAEVIHTRDGRVFRGRIQAESGEEIEAGSPLLIETLEGPVEVDRADLLTVETRTELLRSLHASRRRIASDDAAGHLRLLNWALRKGLFDEAFDLADEVQAGADSPDAAELLEWPPELFRLPLERVTGPNASDASDASGAPDADGLWRLLSHCIGKSPSRALVAEEFLKEQADRTELTETLLRALKDPRARMRRSALKLLAATVPEGTLERVLDRMLFDRDRTVRLAAAHAVQAYREPGVIYPLVRALGQTRANLRLAAMDAIEILNDPRAVGALIRHLRQAGGGKRRNHFASVTQTSLVSDFDVEIAQASVIAQPIVDVVPHGVIHDVGVAGVFERRVRPAERARVGALLEYLTGQEFGTDAQEWERWFAGTQRPGE